jgi:hypothetical protein
VFDFKFGLTALNSILAKMMGIKTPKNSFDDLTEILEEDEKPKKKKKKKKRNFNQVTMYGIHYPVIIHKERDVQYKPWLDSALYLFLFIISI